MRGCMSTESLPEQDGASQYIQVLLLLPVDYIQKLLKLTSEVPSACGNSSKVGVGIGVTERTPPVMLR